MKNQRNKKSITKIAVSVLLGIAGCSLLANPSCRNCEILPAEAQSNSETTDTFNSETENKEDSDSAEESLQASIATKILRFHVLANSDSAEDQALKLLVRDAVGAYLEPLLSESSNLTETEAIVTSNMQDIEATAEAVIGEEGYDYSVSACLAWVDFPEKTYGDYTFPAGEYEALELVIGDGAGQNWWCVLYPNMCFRGSVYEVIDEDAEEELRQVLTPEEYEEVFSSGEVEVRFRLLDFIRNIFI